VALDDGRIDVCIVRARSILDYLKMAWAVLTGQQRQEPHLQSFLAEERVIVETRSELPVQGDGDFIGYPPVEVQVVPGAVQIVVPAADDDGLDIGEWFDFVD
jgi:diacylglycerol kinase family enzyme